MRVSVFTGPLLLAVLVLLLGSGGAARSTWSSELGPAPSVGREEGAAPVPNKLGCVRFLPPKSATLLQRGGHRSMSTLGLCTGCCNLSRASGPLAAASRSRLAGGATWKHGPVPRRHPRMGTVGPPCSCTTPHSGSPHLSCGSYASPTQTAASHRPPSCFD